MKDKGERLLWLLYLIFGLVFLYQHLVTTDLLFKYLFLVLGVFDITLLMLRSGLYNYHHGYYKWL